MTNRLKASLNTAVGGGGRELTLTAKTSGFGLAGSRSTAGPASSFPASMDAGQPEARIEIEFSRGNMIRRFRFWIGDELVYDEVN